MEQNKEIQVKDEFRKNPLSLEPGGHVVRVVYADGSAKIYDKVKFPDKFCRRIKDGLASVSRIEVDGRAIR